MYETCYDLTLNPFRLTPDARFFFESQGHGRAVAHLAYGLSQAEGFIVVTGEVGAGKTMLVERLCSQLDPDICATARIEATRVSAGDLFRLVVAGFGVDETAAGQAGLSRAALLGRFKERLREQRAAGRRCLLVADEAQNLSAAALEELRMLSNLAEDGQASLQTILLGQPQFRDVLYGPGLEHLRQRVLASCHLGPIGETEVDGYILHRLGTAGWQGNPSWDNDAFAAVHCHTGGIPRRINRLCSRVLLLGALEQSDRVTGAMVHDTAEELRRDLEGRAQEHTAPDPVAQDGTLIGLRG